MLEVYTLVFLGATRCLLPNPPFVTDVAFGSAAQRQDVTRTRVDVCPRWLLPRRATASGTRCS
jgi:hypothetical protein